MGRKKIEPKDKKIQIPISVKKEIVDLIGKKEIQSLSEEFINSLLPDLKIKLST